MTTKALSMPEVYRRYRPRILGLLEEVRAAFGAAGCRLAEPYENSGEEYQWVLDGGPEPGNPDISVGITILESRVRDGEDDLGINFSLDIAGKDGRTLGSYTPYNYRPEIWVNRKDLSAIEARWRLFEEACAPRRSWRPSGSDWRLGGGGIGPCSSSRAATPGVRTSPIGTSMVGTRRSPPAGHDRACRDRAAGASPRTPRGLELCS